MRHLSEVSVSISLLFAVHSEGKFDGKNIRAMWPFDEGNRKVAKDSSGNGNDGKIHDAKWVDGKFGKALTEILHKSSSPCGKRAYFSTSQFDE